MGTWASVYGERAGKDGINFQEKPPPPYVLSKTSATMPTFVGISAIGAFDDDAFPKATHTHTGTQTDQCVRLTQLTMDFPLFATAESAVHRCLLGIYTLLTTI